MFEELHASGLVTAEHAFNHCYDLPGRVWELVGGSGAAVNLCPRSDAAFGLGSAVAPVAQALRHAGAVGSATTAQAHRRGEAFRRRAAREDVPADELSPVGTVLVERVELTTVGLRRVRWSVGQTPR